MKKKNVVYWLVVLLIVLGAISFFQGQSAQNATRPPLDQSARISLVVLPGQNPASIPETGGETNGGNS